MLTLYDQFGFPITPESKPDEDILAYTGLPDGFDAFPSKGLTPAKLAAIFQEANQGNPLRQMELFEEMEEKDTHLFSVLSKRRGSVTGLDYEIAPASQDKKDLEIAEFVESQITGLANLEEAFKDIADGIGKGYSAMELFWDVKDGRNVVRHLNRIEQQRFIWKSATEPRLLTKANPYDGIELKPFKFMLHVHKTKSGHPARQGLMRICAWMYLFKNFDIKSWVKFAEIFGIPLRLGKYDSGATPSDKQKLIQAVRAIGQDAAGVISKGTEIEFIEAAKNGNADFYDKLAKFCKAEMSIAVLGQTMTTEQGENGARSLGEVHQGVEDSIQKDDCEQISKSVRRDLIRPLVGFNYGWDVALPWFKFKYEKPEDKNSKADLYGKHLENGVPIGVRQYRQEFDLAEPEADDELLVPQRQRDVASSENAFEAKAGRIVFSNRNIEGDDEDHLGSFVEQAVRQANHDPLVDPILKLLDKSKDLLEFKENLQDAFKDMDDLELGNLIEQGLQIAFLTGSFEALSPEEKEGLVE